MKIAKVASKDIRSVMRLDGSFHLAEANIYEKTILKNKHRLLDGFCENIFTSGRSKRFYTSKERGYPYLSNSDVIAQNPFNSCKYNSKKYAFDANALLKKGMILTGRVGAIGQTAYVTDEFEEKMAMGSDNIIRIVPKKDEYGGFLYAFLTSEIGNKLLWKLATGGVQPYITDSMLAHIPVPIFPQEKQEQIHNLITEAAKLRVEANRLLEEAVEVFEKEIGVSSNTIKTFSKKVKDLGFSWAAYNNNVECASIHEKLEGGSLRLGDLSEDIFAPPLFKHIYLSKDNGYPFITGSELTRQNIRFYRWLSPRGVKDINNYVVCKGSLLLYKSGTTDGGILGNVFIADDNLDGVCLSDHIIRIKIDNIKMSYWVYAFLKSAVGVKLLQQLATGTMIPFITPERLKNLPIPMPDDKYEFVTHAIDVSLQKRVKANNNENQAISLVENEIALWQS